MKIAVISGNIKRRFLINFRIDPKVLQNILPKHFKPILVNGYAVGGICLIRLENIKPKFIKINLGINSENAAHRFAVKFNNKECVYIPRRDTDSRINNLVGGRLFPGIHYHSTFDIEKEDKKYNFHMESDDRKVKINFKGSVSKSFEENSIFSNLEQSSQFFCNGSLGYSDTRKTNKFDGIELKTNTWKVLPFKISELYSSYFEDQNLFPKNSIKYDHSLFMEEINHEWINSKKISRPY